MIPTKISIFILIYLFITPNLFAKEIENEPYLNLLIKEATEKQLAKKRPWHLLLHYKKTYFGNFESEQDDIDFFLSPKGKTNAQAELRATLENFFKVAQTLKNKEEHPQCNFPARYKWLKSELSFDPKKLSEQKCERLDGWLNDLYPEKVTLIFASHYGNNPSSMFGHTLLRIDKKREGPEQKLLNYGVNYAASLDTSNTFLYVIKGLFGLFKGEFSLFPYYVKVQQYNHLENRDIWEYELNFSEDQMNSLLLHLWELGGNYFDYYYFQENCSYHILSLLEVANPELHLTDQFFFSVIPADTVKLVLNHDNLVSKRVYRPSLLNQMNNKLLQMTDREEKAFYSLVENPSFIEENQFIHLKVSEKAIILDTYLDFKQHNKIKHKNVDSKIDKRTRNILLERSRLNFVRNKSEITHFSTPPEMGHDSARMRVGTGNYESESFLDLSYRPTYHDILAKDAGYNKYSQILFFDLNLRYYNDANKVKLDKFKIIDIISLTPYEPLFKKKSWKLNLEIDTLKDISCNYCNSFKGNYGTGLSYKPSYYSSLLLYSMIDFEGELSKHLKENYRMGAGVTAGMILDVTDDWKIQSRIRHVDFPLGHESDYSEININQMYSISQNLDSRIELMRKDNRDEWILSLNYYF